MARRKIIFAIGLPISSSVRDPPVPNKISFKGRICSLEGPMPIIGDPLAPATIPNEKHELVDVSPCQLSTVDVEAAILNIRKKLKEKLSPNSASKLGRELIYLADMAKLLRLEDD
ncbi:hypothetical protein OsI_33540 [Oryza sativa Indica Group]|uniref:Uncharacterized protein n=1 Tax=Oryza sativa subsp. indica TaxID=39946 RepID=B8BGS9_ORYSI|nr:hypothetical protein OsI_33540 [Oryza sativa Indica Group]